MFHTIVLMIHVFAAMGLIGLVLLQHGKGADAGAAFGSGASSTVFGARGSASFLTRATGILAAVFFTTSLSLAYMAGHRGEHRSITEKVQTQPAPAPAAPTPPAAPSDVPAAPPGTPSDIPAAPPPPAPPG